MRAKNTVELHDKLRMRKRGYQVAFGQPGGQVAWTDFARFCRAFENEDMPADRDRMLILFGRREAFFRIFAHLKLEPDELAQFFRAVVDREGDQQ